MVWNLHMHVYMLGIAQNVCFAEISYFLDKLKEKSGLYKLFRWEIHKGLKSTPFTNIFIKTEFQLCAINFKEME